MFYEFEREDKFLFSGFQKWNQLKLFPSMKITKVKSGKWKMK